MNVQVDKPIFSEEMNASACRLCGTTLRRTFVDLGMSPLCESYITRTQKNAMEPFFPLHALVCEQCFLVQLSEYVTREEIFQEYAYFSSYSTSWVAHAKNYCNMIASRIGLGPSSRVVELASNDGYLLQHFQPMGVPVLGIEPARNIAEVARAKGIETRSEFFGSRCAEQLVADGMAADLIVANNVLAHVPDLNDFVRGIKILLKPDGIVTVEVPHLERLMSGNQFDTIYHEHFSYFSFVTLDRLAKRHQLKLIDVEEIPTHGGSLRVYLARAVSGHQPRPDVKRLLDHERALGFEDMALYETFDEHVKRTKRDLLTFLIAAKNDGRRICGYGAPGKGNTLLNYCGIGPDFLEFTVDRNPYKHGRFTPGMRIPIHPVEMIDIAKPNYILILPWNLTPEITHQMRHVAEWGAQFVIPIPEVKIINAAEIEP